MEFRELKICDITKNIKNDKLIQNFQNNYWDYIKVFLCNCFSYYSSNRFITLADHYLLSLQRIHTFFKNTEFQFNYDIMLAFKSLNLKEYDFSSLDIFYNFDPEPNLKQLAQNLISCIPEFIYHIQIYFIVDVFLDPKSYSNHFEILKILFINLKSQFEKIQTQVQNPKLEDKLLKQIFDIYQFLYYNSNSNSKSEENGYHQPILKKLSCKEPKTFENKSLEKELHNLKNIYLGKAREDLIKFFQDVDRIFKYNYNIEYYDDFIDDIINKK